MRTPLRSGVAARSPDVEVPRRVLLAVVVAGRWSTPPRWRDRATTRTLPDPRSGALKANRGNTKTAAGIAAGGRSPRNPPGDSTSWSRSPTGPVPAIVRRAPCWAQGSFDGASTVGRTLPASSCPERGSATGGMPMAVYDLCPSRRSAGGQGGYRLPIPSRVTIRWLEVDDCLAPVHESSGFRLITPRGPPAPGGSAC